MVGLLSAGFGLFWDRLWIKLNCKEQVRVGWLVPIGEETIKLILARLFSVPLFGINIFFGFWEGLHEVLTGELKNDWMNRIKHFGAAILIHTMFGAVYLIPLPLWTRFLSGMTLHMAWNQFILKNNYQSQRKKE